MPAMRRYLTATGAAAAATGLLAAAGCSGGDDPLPDAAGLLSSAAEEMARVETVAMQLEADTGVTVADLPLRAVDGVVTRDGDAEGTAQVEQFGQRVEVRFVVVDDTFHFQLIGAWQEVPLSGATDFYDPSAILDPDRGVANLLRSATDATVEGRDGDRYEVTATFPATAVEVLLPGVAEEVRGTVWIGVDRPLPQQARLPVPAGAGEPGTLTIGLSDFDEPVTVVAP